jgi:hypothetical protein
MKNSYRSCPVQGQLGNQSWGEMHIIVSNRLKRGMGWTNPDWCGRRYITLELLWTEATHSVMSEKTALTQTRARGCTEFLGNQNETDDVNASVCSGETDCPKLVNKNKAKQKTRQRRPKSRYMTLHAEKELRSMAASTAATSCLSSMAASSWMAATALV